MKKYFYHDELSKKEKITAKAIYKLLEDELKFDNSKGVNVYKSGSNRLYLLFFTDDNKQVNLYYNYMNNIVCYNFNSSKETRKEIALSNLIKGE